MNRLPRWSLILISFAIALSLWAFLFVRANPTNNQIKSGILEVKNLAPNLVVIDETGRRQTTFPVVEAQIFAAQSAFSQLPAAGLTFYVDVADKGPGEYELPVQVDWRPEWGYFRSEIRAEQQVVTIRLEEVISKVFVPEIETTGVSSDAVYNRSSTLADPTTEVTVTGPQTLVNQVEGARLRFAYNASQMGSTESIVVVPVNAQGEQVFGVDVTPSQVDVVVIVEPKLGIRSVVIVPNLVGVVASGYEITSIEADPLTVAIQGDVQTISNTTTIDTDAISVMGLSQTFTQTVALKLNNVSLVDVKNTTAKVRVEIAPIERNTRMRLLVPIEIRDVPEGFVFVTNPAVYVLDVLIEPEALRRNALGLVQAFISVGEWDIAQPSRQVQVLLPANIRRESELTFVNVQQVAPSVATPEAPLIEETATAEIEPEVTGTVVTTTTPIVVTTTAIVATMTPTVVPTLTMTSTPVVSDN
jgi:YbbR domain-containing protein